MHVTETLRFALSDMEEEMSHSFADMIRSNSLYSINFSTFFFVGSIKGVTFATLIPGSP